MKVLNNNELSKINGGISGGHFFIAGVVAFLIGFFDGFTRPLKCN